MESITLENENSLYISNYPPKREISLPGYTLRASELPELNCRSDLLSSWLVVTLSKISPLDVEFGQMIKDPWVITNPRKDIVYEYQKTDVGGKRINLERYLKDKLKEIEEKIEAGTLEDKDGLTLLTIRTILEKQPIEDVQKKYYEIIENLKKEFPYVIRTVDSVLMITDEWTPGFRNLLKLNKK